MPSGRALQPGVLLAHYPPKRLVSSLTYHGWRAHRSTA